jgi:hypothetical protein
MYRRQILKQQYAPFSTNNADSLPPQHHLDILV